MIAGYMGSSKRFDDIVSEFASPMQIRRSAIIVPFKAVRQDRVKAVKAVIEG